MNPLTIDRPEGRMTMTPLQQMLFGMKLETLDKEKRATGYVRDVMTVQVGVIDAMLRFLASQQTEEDMTKLKLTLETQAVPVESIKPRQDHAELAEAIIELADHLKEQFEMEELRAKKEKRAPTDIAIPLNNLPPEVRPHTVATKVYDLRKKLKIPANLVPATRRIESKEEAEKVKLNWNGKATEIVYIKWMQKPPELGRTRKARGF